MKTHQDVCNALLECKTKREVIYVVGKSRNMINKDPGLKDLLRSTIKRIDAVRIVKELNSYTS
jgi:hypothetical protein